MGLPIEWEHKLYAKYPKGPRNLITDVPGVTVGHVTLKNREVNTGVTAVLPHGGNLFRDKVMAGSCVINGFGKTTGLVQVEELGTIETPIILTNTLNVGTAWEALTRYMLEQSPEIGVTTGTVNPVIAECNDGYLNDIRGLHVRPEHIPEAIRAAGEEFEEGAVGAGTGMVCMGLKGGIGSASRRLFADGDEYRVGALCLTNFGCTENLMIGGEAVGRRICRKREEEQKEEQKNRAEQRQEEQKNRAELRQEEQKNRAEQRQTQKDQGSVIILLATDLPLNERQLRRLAKRSMAALGRVGSYCGNGSGDIAIAFSVTNRLPHESDRRILDTKLLFDGEIDPVFEAGVEAVEEAVISSLVHAETVQGFMGHTVHALREYYD